MQDNLIDQGLNLMLYGMGTVFVFLTILVFATGLMSKIVNRLAPEAIEDHQSSTPPNAVPTPRAAAGLPKHHKLAIEQAIALHRKR